MIGVECPPSWGRYSALVPKLFSLISFPCALRWSTLASSWSVSHCFVPNDLSYTMLLSFLQDHLYFSFYTTPGINSKCATNR